MSLPDARPIEILMVDDDPGDVLLVREALSTAAPSTRLQVLSDGSEVIPYLRREGDHAGARRPGPRFWQTSTATQTCAASPSWC